jgi:predicted secreted protein
MRWLGLKERRDTMSSSFRVLAVVGILILAAAGCQKGEKPGATADAGSKAEIKAAGSKSGGSRGKAFAKTGGSDTRGTAAQRDDGSKASGRVGTLTAADDGREFDLRQGQVVTVMLNSNRSTGMSWVLVNPDGAVMVQQGTPVYVAKQGGSGTETWRFRAARPGHQTVRLEYRRKWAQSMPERTFRFMARVR